VENLTAEGIVAWAVDRFGHRLALSTSFQPAGMVVLDMAARRGGPFRVFTLDTGRLPEETHQMMETVRRHYGLEIEVVMPDPGEVEAMVRQHGPNLFYRSVELRTLCCQVRKVRPLERKLKEFKAWMAGMRRDQAESRIGILKVDLHSPLVKIHPIADWTRAEVDDYIRRHGVPVHPLYARGYTSIGCEPCTRATGAGEDERAGRWWWEQGASKECGIHFEPDGTARRAVDVLLGQIVKPEERNRDYA
jgi:phosphoadenylyl-sulfate reductase (thioredoxin)